MRKKVPEEWTGEPETPEEAPSEEENGDEAEATPHGLSLGSKLMLGLALCVTILSLAFLFSILSRDFRGRAGELLSQLRGETTVTESAETPIPTAIPLTPAPTPEPTRMPKVTASPTPVPEVCEASIAIGGTVYAPKSIRQSALSGNEYDFAPIFRGLDGVFSQADLSIVTLETLTAGGVAGDYGIYNTDAALLSALRGCGVSMLSLATERALDAGCAALDVTLSEITSRGMMAVGIDPDGTGGGASLRVNGIDVAVLAYSYGLSEESAQAKESERAVLMLMDEARMLSDIQQARREGAKLVIVLPHWGTKNSAQVPSALPELAAKLANAGADIIVGTHSNVVQRTARITAQRESGLTAECVVCYSAGSLLTDARAPENAAGAIFTIPVTYDPVSRATSLGEMQITPTCVLLQSEEDGTVYRVVDAESAEVLSELTEEAQAEAQAAAALVRQAAEE